ncbi:ISL3 family transposase [Leptolyngbya boryana CZ1]|uniref:ISL3 family transposase n=1 Tax=Leptolyngbya boryana CZ1 TaxID=3060204 RepID=A0AA96WPR8_LEPBY|nr:ISL3 family transposase [Leptolyngbya boryana]WNZ43785.1 ISL3 family transposase [Leptolyngbya boryana CZ1]
MELFNELLPNREHPQLQDYQVDRDQHVITIFVCSTQSSNSCPLCEQRANQVHSRYRRILADLAWADYRIGIKITVRKFFCRNSRCERRIFTERLPDVMEPWARRTQRLAEQLYEIAQRLGGAAGTKLSKKIHCGVSRNTLLRLLFRQPLPAYEVPKTLGVDDFAFRKRLSYGTILVDLDARKPIALLKGRDASLLAEWLRQHPGVEVLSRDRSPVYKSGMSQGAPNAIQVADRFHLIHNLAEVLEQVFRSHNSDLRHITSTHTDHQNREELERSCNQGESIETVEPLSTVLERLDVPMKTYYQRRRALHHVVWQLFEQGWSTEAIARYTEMSIRTVQRDLNKPKHVEHQRRADYGQNLASPYRDYILQRCTLGHRCVGLLAELQAQGYKGSDRTLRRYLKWLASEEPSKEPTALSLPALPLMNAPPPTAWHPPLSANRATWLVLRKTEPETLREQQLLNALQSSPQFALAIDLAQSFARLVREQQPEHFEAWLDQALHSQIAAFVNFANGLKEDFAAVQAAMKLSVSNGQVEGQINRLKLLKRQMYGRAGIELLRRRFLVAN